MQRNKQKYYTKRVLLYTGGMLRGELKVGEKYEELKDVIMINILNYTMFKNIDKVHTIWKLRENNYPELGALEGLEIHFIELEKFRESKPDMYNKLNQWLALIDTENERWVEVAMEDNKKIKEAKERVEDFMSEDEARILAQLREKWQMDYDSAISGAKEDGIEEGIEQGIEQGSLETKINIARKLLLKNIDIQEIIEITGLDKTEILKLKNK